MWKLLGSLYQRIPSWLKEPIYAETTCHVLGILLRGIAIRKLKEESTKCKTVGDHVDLAFSFRFGPPALFSIKPAQLKEEISEFLKILQTTRPKTILEIGTERGGTFYLLTKVASSDATLISMDLPGGPFGGGYPRWKTFFYKSFGSVNQKLHLLRMNSHDPSTLHEVKKILGELKLDLLYVDGDHSYEGVKLDFEMYGKLVRRGGMIAFHDIVPNVPERRVGVPAFWNEIKNGFNFTEIVKNRGQIGCGIGVIFR